MTEKLKPCPFCGGEATISPYLELGNLYMVICRNCNTSRVGKSEGEAVKEWNTRPNHWHTGTPTDEGWYLIQTKRVDVDTDKYIFKVGNLSDVLWFQSEGHKELSCYGIVAWQKIEPYEAKMRGKT